MRLSSNEVESRNHCTQLTVKPPPLTLSSGSVPASTPLLEENMLKTPNSLKENFPTLIYA